MRAYIVVDLGFGDSGKGLLTDFLVRQTGANVVVRYNGGAQAGHNVVTPDGRTHTFSQFGAGSFVPNVKTYLSRHVVIHPSALLIEGDMLARKGVMDPYSRLKVSEQALVITPFHQAANRIREIMRGSARHGSCGVGVGEAVEDSLLGMEASVVAGDLRDPRLLRRKLFAIRDRKREQLIAFNKDIGSKTFPVLEWEVFEREHIIDDWCSEIERIIDLGLVATEEVLQKWLKETDCAVFEGAQGVLLDADAGFHPYTTWSRCTTRNALDLLNEFNPQAKIYQIGVLRAYAMRHGPGPLPTETGLLAGIISEHNQHNDWQGSVRYGWFDAVLAQYALSVIGKVDTLMVTHMDVLPHLNMWRYCRGYKQTSRQTETLTSLPLLAALPLDLREKITRELLEIKPILESCLPEAETVINKIEALTGQSVGLISTGPSMGDIRTLKQIPS